MFECFETHFNKELNSGVLVHFQKTLKQMFSTYPIALFIFSYVVGHQNSPTIGSGPYVTC